MIITPHLVDFKTLSAGACFHARHHYFIKLGRELGASQTEVTFNAVCLGTGNPATFETKEAVTFFPKARIEPE